MKAEQRKELETNALADRMGHLMQRMKTRPQRATLYYVVGILVVVIALIVVWRTIRWNQEKDATRWEIFDSGVGQNLQYLAKNDPDTNAGKAARFQDAWDRYWNLGVKRLGIGQGFEGVKELEFAALEYRKLAEECTGDKVWEPEALYALAVIEETKAIMNIKHLDEAKKFYEDVKSKHPKSARGELAAEWLKNADDKEKYDKLKEFYQELHTALGVIDFDALNRQLRQNRDLLAPKKDTKKTK